MSGAVIGAVWSQKVEGVERPIAYASRKLKEHKRRYVMVNRGCLLLKWGMECFKYNLLGHEFTLIPDHATSMWLRSAKMDNAWIMCWALALQPFQFSVEYM